MTETTLPGPENDTHPLRTSRIAKVLPAGTEALTGQQVAGRTSEAVRNGLGVFTKVLLAFAAVALLVGSFVIWNTFNVLVAQRRREVALLRAVDATRSQVRTVVRRESVLMSLLGASPGSCSARSADRR